MKGFECIDSRSRRGASFGDMIVMLKFGIEIASGTGSAIGNGKFAIIGHLALLDGFRKMPFGLLVVLSISLFGEGERVKGPREKDFERRRRGARTHRHDASRPCQPPGGDRV